MLRKCVLVGLAFLTATLAGAAQFTPTTPDTLFLTVLSLDSNSSIIGFDLRGTVGGTVDALGTVYITDGTPLGFPSPTSPNSFLLIINAALDQYGVLTFALPTIGGPGLQETATFAPFTAITDPALAALVNSAPLLFDYSFNNRSVGPVIGNQATTLSQWQLVDATSTAPEPGSLALMGLGVVCIGFRARRGLRRAA
jgi:hypothetical protein